jgi:hypothetical protein
MAADIRSPKWKATRLFACCPHLAAIGFDQPWGMKMKTKIAPAAFAVLLGAAEPAACQSGGFDTSSYPKPVPQASFLDMLQQSNEIELQQLEIQRRQMQLNQQRYLQEQAREREQREFEARAAEQYRQRHAGDAAAAEAWRKRHAGKPVQLAPTKVSN